MYFCYFVTISPWKWFGSFIWTNLNPLHPKDALCQACLKLVQWFLRRWLFFNFVDVFSLFHNYLPLEKGRALHSNKLGSRIPVVLEKKMKMWKVYDNNNDNNDANEDNNDDNDDGQRTNFDQKSSIEPSAHVSKKVHSSIPLYLGFQFYVPQTRQNSAFHPYSNV